MERSNEITSGENRHRNSHFVISLFRYFVEGKGFTLVELIVSMAITSIIMLGMSVFFSSTFQSLFQAQVRAENTAKQFAVNEIIKEKFTKLDKILDLNDFSDSPLSSDRVFFKNKITENQMPFSYIGAHDTDMNDDGKEEIHLVFKDMLIFNKVYYRPNPNPLLTYFFADSGAGDIKNANDGIVFMTLPAELKNFSSFEIIGDNYYIVLPDKNRVVKCTCVSGSCNACADLSNMSSKLQSPTDIAKDRDEKYFYISDSGNGRIIKYDAGNEKEYIAPSPPPSLVSSPFAEGLKYPTGLAYYYDGATEWLFVAETFGNKIRKINLTTPSVISTVVGDGEDTECNHTAKFCKLNMPTGLFVDDDKNELYISDSGNNRILKMKDPEIPTSLNFDFKLDENYALDLIEFENPLWDGSGIYDETGSNLIGSASNFSDKKFQNSDHLTVFSNSVCQSSDKTFYVHEPPPDPEFLKAENKLIIGSNAYTVMIPRKEIECKLSGEEPSLTKWRIIVQEDASSVSDGQSVYFSNPTDVNVKIKDIPLSPAAFTGSSFQTFAIKTYDISNKLIPIETDYSSVRIGDGKLGTDEDTIEVIIDKTDYGPISFPTGVTDQYFANSGGDKTDEFIDNKKIMKMNISAGAIFQPVDFDAFDTFDYLSDFALNDSYLDGVKFKILNNYKLLEMVVKAMVDDSNYQTYTLDAAFKS